MITTNKSTKLHEDTFQNKGYYDFRFYYHTALKGCRGIVFTHGVWLGGGGKMFVRAVSQKPLGVGS